MKYLKKFEAIGFKIKNDNRDSDPGIRTKLGFVKSENFDKKLIELVSKLKYMAEMGDTGERDVAKRKLNDISLKYRVNVDELTKSRQSRVGFRFSWDDIENDERELEDIKMIEK